MSSVTDGEPGPEGSGLADPRRGRGRGRRGRLWRRQDEQLPDAGELGRDEVEALMRLGSTPDERDHRPEDAGADDAAEAFAKDEDPDSIFSRVGGRSGNTPTRPVDTDDVDWRALVAPAEDDRPLVPERAEPGADSTDAAGDRTHLTAPAADQRDEPHNEAVQRLQAELLEIQQQALEHARARAEAEAVAASQAQARAEAEARAAELAEKVAEIQARIIADAEAAAAAPAPPPAPATTAAFTVLPAADESPVEAEPAGEPEPLDSPLDPQPSLVERWRAGTSSFTTDETDELIDVGAVDSLDDSPADSGSAPAEPPSLLDQWRGTTATVEPGTELEAVDSTADALSEAPVEGSAAADAEQGAFLEPEVVAEPEPVPQPEPVPEPEPEPQPAPEPHPVQPEPEPRPEPTATPAAVKRIPFRSRRGNGSLPWLATIAALACAFLVGRMAYRGTLWDDVSLSATLTVLTVILLGFGLKAGSSARSVHLDESGILKVTVGDTNTRFDLTNPNTRIEQTGAPGQRNWRVLILRRSMSPVTIDSHMVDPHTFMEALRQWRPDL